MEKKLTFTQGTHPYFFPGGTTGCLLVHGFTSTPFNLRWLGEHLSEQGYAVHGPRIAGHGATMQELNEVTWREWYLSVLGGYHLLREHCDKMVVIGFSFGGVLSSLIASQQEVDALILMAAPHTFHSRYGWLLPFLSQFVGKVPKTHLPPEGEDTLQQRVKEEQRRRGEAEVGIPGLYVWPLRAVTHMRHVLRMLPAAQAKISAPTLLMHGKKDATVPFTDMQAHYDALGTTDKQIMSFENSGHDLSLDVEADAVYEAVDTFIHTKVGR